MLYKYKVFNLICSSTVPLPSFIVVEENVKPDFQVALGIVKPSFINDPNVNKNFIQFRLWLFAAPSKTGKSTTALKLKEKGYNLFTDDTALIKVEDNCCLAVASYPVLRAWENTMNNQKVYARSEGKQLRAEVNKFGVSFHKDFIGTPKKVSGIVFLEERGNSIQIERIKSIDGIKLLGDNIYRNTWVKGMNKQLLQFQTLSAISQKVSFWKATRPKNISSFDSFSQAIIDQIIEI